MAPEKSQYALLWANGMTFAQIYDIMRAEIERELLAERLAKEESDE